MATPHVCRSDPFLTRPRSRRSLHSARILALAGLLFVAAGPFHAADPPSLGRDLQLEIKARQSLLQDPQLGGLNLGLTVRDGVARLWGPVPSVDLARRAVERLRQLPELREIRNDLIVVASRAPAPQVLPPPTPGKPGRDLPGSPIAPNERLRPQVRAAEEPGAAVVLPPITIPLPAAPRSRTTAPIVSTATATNLPATWLIEEVNRLCQGNARYRGLRPEVRGRVVYLSGQVARWEDVHELARLIRRMQGVESVILRDIRTGP
jgi:hypothetical protein